MLNQVSIQGRLTADPELRHTPNGNAVTSFTLACARAYVKKGEEREADFIDVVAWRNTAEFVAKYFTKGTLILVEGRLQTRAYKDRDGNNRKATEIIATHVYFSEAQKREHDEFDQTPRYEESFSQLDDNEDLPF